MSKKERIVYYDYLRVWAIVAVVVLHVATGYWSSVDGRSLAWHTFNVYNSITRWGVPVFLMISGSLFLGRNLSINTILKKYVLRLVIVYGVWSTFYAISFAVGRKMLEPGYHISYKDIIAKIITGHFHLWFIPMLIGLYLCIPLFQLIISKVETMNYFLVLSFLFAFLIPETIYLVNDYIGGSVATVFWKVSEVVSDMSMSFVKGYGFYFILGYKLSNMELTEKQRKIIYCLGALGFVTTILFNGVITWKTQRLCDTYYGSFNVNVALEAIAVFVWFKYKEYSNEKLNRWMIKLSQYSLGVYLIHTYVVNVLSALGLNAMSFCPILSVPVITVLELVISVGLIAILHKIPIVNRWIV